MLGVDEAALVGDNYSACQTVGAAAALLRLDGIIVPSASSPGRNIVILFASPESIPVVDVIESIELEA